MVYNLEITSYSQEPVSMLNVCAKVLKAKPNFWYSLLKAETEIKVLQALEYSLLPETSIKSSALPCK